MKEVRKVFVEGFKGLVQIGDTYTLYTYVETFRVVQVFVFVITEFSFSQSGDPDSSKFRGQRRRGGWVVKLYSYYYAKHEVTTSDICGLFWCMMNRI